VHSFLASCARLLVAPACLAVWLCVVWLVTQTVQACQHQLRSPALPCPALPGCVQELLPVALQLHTLYQPAPLLPTHAARLTRHAWAQLMATLVLTGGWLGGWVAGWVAAWAGGCVVRWGDGAD
jgi:hypothetical protein